MCRRCDNLPRVLPSSPGGLAPCHDRPSRGSDGPRGTKVATPRKCPWIWGITRDAPRKLQLHTCLASQQQPLPKRHLSPIAPEFQVFPRGISIFFHPGRAAGGISLRWQQRCSSSPARWAPRGDKGVERFDDAIPIFTTSSAQLRTFPGLNHPPGSH